MHPSGMGPEEIPSWMLFPYVCFLSHSCDCVDSHTDALWRKAKVSASLSTGDRRSFGISVVYLMTNFLCGKDPAFQCSANSAGEASWNILVFKYRILELQPCAPDYNGAFFCSTMDLHVLGSQVGRSRIPNLSISKTVVNGDLKIQAQYNRGYLNTSYFLFEFWTSAAACIFEHWQYGRG